MGRSRPRRSRIAMLVPGPSACPETSTTRALRRGLTEAGYTEDRDFSLDRRCFPTEDTAAAVAANLLKQRPTVFVAAGHRAAIAVRNLATVPVVFAGVDDPAGHHHTTVSEARSRYSKRRG